MKEITQKNLQKNLQKKTVCISLYKYAPTFIIGLDHTKQSKLNYLIQNEITKFYSTSS